MLNTFPNLLVLGFFAPTILRVAAAGLLLYAAYAAQKHKHEAAGLQFPVIGRAPWAATFASIAYAVIGLLLLFGAYTQIAAILGALTALKSLVLGGRFPALFPYSRSTYVLLLAICLSLLVSGAGALAYDLPL